MRRTLPFLLLLFFTSLLAQAEKPYPANPNEKAFDAAYAQNPQIPEGILEAVAWKMSRFRHLDSTDQESCHGIPRAYGIMGLIGDGQGIFRNNLPMIALLSSYSEKELVRDPEKHVRAYAEAYTRMMDTLGIQSKAIEEHVPVLCILSELPFNGGNVEEFAMSSRLYDILQQLENPAFQKAYGLPKRRIPFDSIFGTEDHKVLKSEGVRIGNERIQGSNGGSFQGGALRHHEYPNAIWDPAPSCNYSSRNGTAISAVTIHTMQGTYAGAISWAQNCNSNVSFHYAVRSSDGQVTQLVHHADKAWHVGSENPYTIGIEHEGYINDPTWLTTALYTSSADIVKYICNSGYGIDPLRTHNGPACSGSSNSCQLGGCIRIKGHQHFPNQSHTDPGPHYDWEYYYRLINPNPPTTNFTQGSGTFYDSGGPTGNYGDDERHVYTIDPPQSNYIDVTVNSFHIENGWDSLFVYDGADINAPLIGGYSGTNIPSTFSSSGGAITFEFRSDCATNESGWSISWDAVPLDSIAPTTTVNPQTDWKSDDFDVTFNDQDSGGSGLEKSFYQVIHFDGTEWRANHRNGFFSDNFDQGSVHPDWTSVSGTWNENSGYLEQSNESLSNTNLYAALEQDTPSNRYLYHWVAKIHGSGTNKRAGLHIFCDEPDSSNRGDSYFIWFRQDDQAIQLFKSVNNSWGSGPVEQTSYPIQANTWYDLKMSYDRITGEFRIYVDDSLALEWTDGNPISTGNSISFRSGNAQYSIQKLKVYRSRFPSETVSVGADTTSDLRYQNPSPSQPAGKVKTIAQDSAGNISAIGQEPIDIDWTPPQLGDVRDGLSGEEDTLPDDTVRAHWDPAVDPHSGLLEYEYAVDSVPGDSSIVPWTVNTDTSMKEALANPIDGTTYFTSIRARNNAGLMAGDSTSDGTLYLRPSTAIEENEDPIGKLQVYPSPAHRGEQLKLRYRTQKPLTLHIELFDERGRLIEREEANFSGSGEERIEADLSPGVHYLRVSGEEVERRSLPFVVR